MSLSCGPTSTTCQQASRALIFWSPKRHSFFSSTCFCLNCQTFWRSSGSLRPLLGFDQPVRSLTWRSFMTVMPAGDSLCPKKNFCSVLCINTSIVSVELSRTNNDNQFNKIMISDGNLWVSVLQTLVQLSYLLHNKELGKMFMYVECWNGWLTMVTRMAGLSSGSIALQVNEPG